MGEKTGPLFRRVYVFDFCGPLASHDSNLCPNRSRIARYNATTIGPSRITQLIPQEFSGVTEMNLLRQLIP